MTSLTTSIRPWPRPRPAEPAEPAARMGAGRALDRFLSRNGGHHGQVDTAVCGTGRAAAVPARGGHGRHELLP
jgi:hypothetical protein